LNFNSAIIGGGIYYHDVDLMSQVSDCNISDNTAQYGAGMYVDPNSPATIVDTMLLRNDASQDGGGIYLDEVNDVSVVNCHIERNTATRGAGLYCFDSTDLTISGCFIRFNTAPVAIDPNDPNAPNTAVIGQGGGIWCWGTPAVITDCVIAHNTATTSGGGLYLTKDPNSPAIINCLIVNNLAGRDGGGISVNWYSRPYIANCTFVGNAASGIFGTPEHSGFGGGIYAGYHSDPTITDSIFWNNFAVDGDEIAVGTGFEYDDPWPATMSISYSDVKGGQSNMRVEAGCLPPDWGPGNITTDPLFVIGPLGDYYLSQKAAKQDQTSPCVNAGSTDASILGMTNYTTRTDEVFDKGDVDMGYHYPLSKMAEPCKLCDLIFDGLINFKDYAKFAVAWLDEGCSDSDQWCGGADFTFNSIVDGNDLAFFADCWLEMDTRSPIPDPSQWRTEPYSPTFEPPCSIRMVAKTAYDAWGWQPWYYFECVSDSNYDSGWQDSSTYEVAGLLPGTELCFKVYTRDSLDLNNITGYSQVECAIACKDIAIDDTPPAPAPHIDEIHPSPTSLAMVASASNDDSGVEYYFKCYSGDCHDSNWQDEPNYTDVNIAPDTNYCYRVQARDKSLRQNTTIWSEVVCEFTSPAPDTNAPTPNPMEWDRSLDANGFDGKPRVIHRGIGFFDYWATMRADPNTDDESGYWEFKFECTNDRDLSSVAQYPETDGWIYFPAGPPYIYEVKQGQEAHEPTFRVMARDMYGDENKTGWSPIEMATTPFP